MYFLEKMLTEAFASSGRRGEHGGGVKGVRIRFVCIIDCYTIDHAFK